MAAKRAARVVPGTRAARSATSAKSAGENSEAHGRSTIEFPYLDLADAMKVATALHKIAGFGSCQPDQLAAAFDSTTTSGQYRARLSAARMFGLVENDHTGPGGIKLTSLGKLAVDPAREREAKVKAFLVLCQSSTDG